LASGTIKNIIFDLGGVLVNIDPDKTANAFAALGNKAPVDIINLHNSQNFFRDYEKGLINDQTFRKNICKFLDTHIPAEIIDKAWGALLLDIPPNKIRLIDNARKKYRTFLLSNTNNIHRIKFEKDFRDVTGKEIREYFENIHYSYEMHARKPDEEIFLKVLEENQLIAEETLLIDDSLPNIETAKSLGMQTFHVERNQEVIEIEG
jgi:putative hydrolase of the HAD superfamily